ncbi:MAG: DNA repair protein RecN [Deltaproteobacteria bacterium]|nr:DNA repair protein RecN [Deltaproteobacteria bacterium]
MLTCLHVQNFAIIDELSVELGPGLNVFSGETGAGKSILVRALSLILGDTASGDLVRRGAEQAEVEALFELGADPELRLALEEAGLPAQDELVIRRVVKATGRSRAYLDGKLASRPQLAALSARLVDISSQHAHFGLTDARTHLGYLDAFGKHGAKLAKLAEDFDALKRATAVLHARLEASSKRAEREDLLRFQLAEVDELAPEAGEDERLAAERERLRHAERLLSSTSEAEATLYADDGALTERLARVAQELEDTAKLDPSLAPLVEQLRGAATQLEDAARELGAYARGVSLDPVRLAEVDERVEGLKRLGRKHGGSLEAALAFAERARAELASLGDLEEKIARAERDRDLAREKARMSALGLRDARKKTAMRMGRLIGKELGSLGMGDARVVVALAPLERDGGELEVEGARLTRKGIDRCELLIAPNVGEEARPLSKVASGGELSRAMLAIKRVLADLGPAGLYVFDEVDSGVGGAVAEVLGRKLADVASHRQVLCITHLPQIAVYADAHFRVDKRAEDGRTTSRIERIDDEARLDEVARMLGGLRITKKTRAAAQELLDGARV